MKIKSLILACLTVAPACAEEHDHTPLEFHIEGDRILAIGEIDGTSLDAFENVVADHPGIRILVLDHVGGSVDDDANVEFSRVVRNMGFTTVVPSHGLVASGGTDLFLAGASRIVEPGACVGVHSWAAETFTATDISRKSAEHDRYLDYYDDIEIEPAFYWFTIQAAPADGMHWMTAMEVDQYGVATRPATSLSTAVTCDAR